MIMITTCHIKYSSDSYYQNMLMIMPLLSQSCLLSISHTNAYYTLWWLVLLYQQSLYQLSMPGYKNPNIQISLVSLGLSYSIIWTLVISYTTHPSPLVVITVTIHPCLEQFIHIPGLYLLKMPIFISIELTLCDSWYRDNILIVPSFFWQVISFGQIFSIHDCPIWDVPSSFCS